MYDEMNNALGAARACVGTRWLPQVERSPAFSAMYVAIRRGALPFSGLPALHIDDANRRQR